MGETKPIGSYSLSSVGHTFMRSISCWWHTRTHERTQWGERRIYHHPITLEVRFAIKAREQSRMCRAKPARGALNVINLWSLKGGPPVGSRKQRCYACKVLCAAHCFSIPFLCSPCDECGEALASRYARVATRISDRKHTRRELFRLPLLPVHNGKLLMKSREGIGFMRTLVTRVIDPTCARLRHRSRAVVCGSIGCGRISSE